MRDFSLIAALAFVLMAPGASWSADLLYVVQAIDEDNASLGIAKYDVSLGTSQSIQDSAQFSSVNGQVLYGLYGLAFNSVGDLYVTDLENNRVMKFNSSGLAQTISTNVSSPNGIAIDSADNVYISNMSISTYGDSISKFDSSGQFLGFIGSSSTLNAPTGLAFDSVGNLYAGNFSGHSISKFDSQGVYQSSITTNLGLVQGIAIDSSDNIYAASEGNFSPYANTISKFDSQGVYQSSITTNLDKPYGITFDSFGNLYVANPGNHTISKFDSSGIFQFSWYAYSPRFLAFGPGDIVVPEPSTYIMGTIAALTMGVLARRRCTT